MNVPLMLGHWAPDRCTATWAELEAACEAVAARTRGGMIPGSLSKGDRDEVRRYHVTEAEEVLRRRGG